MKRGKKYIETAKLVDSTALYERDEAVDLAKKVAVAKFDETIEVHIKTGCDGRHAPDRLEQVKLSAYWFSQKARNWTKLRLRAQILQAARN